MSKEETVEVTVKVPKPLMDMIEEQAYFGWAREDFFVVATRSIVGAEMSEMPSDKMHELQTKYGKNISRVDLSLKKEGVIGRPSVVRVTFTVAKFAVDFLEDYLKFLGSSWTVGDLARDAFFEEICGIRDKLMDMWHQMDGDFFKKYPHVKMLDNREQQNRIWEQERRSDC